METYLVFNDLSVAATAPDEASARQRLDVLAEILVDPRIGGTRVLVTPPAFLQLPVSEGYAIGRWAAKDYKPADREKRVRVKTLMDRRKSYAECDEEGLLWSSEVEYRCGGETARGLATAFLVDGLAVSLSSGERWDAARIRIEKSWVEGDDVATHHIAVAHACRAGHLEEHGEWLRRVGFPTPANGMELWNARERLFPSLDFCDSAGKQIQGVSNGKEFNATESSLKILQNFCESWDTAYFNIHAVPTAAPESKSTMQQYSEERTFLCPDGKKRVFEWHVKKFTVNWRTHFYDFPAQRRLLVGYVGPHLPTAKY